MRIIFFLLNSLSILILYSIEMPSQGKWEKMNSPATQTIWKLSSLDSLHSWAVGDSGLIIHTSNGGVDWQIQNSGVTELVQDIFFLNNKLGWAISTRFDSVFGSYILRTTNGGEIWEREFFRTESKFFHTIYFLDTLNGFVAGGPSEAFYKTSDGGKSWNSPRLDSNVISTLPVQAISFYSKQYGFACGGLHDLVGVIWRTLDSGVSWSSQFLGPEPLRKLYFIDSLHIIGVGGDFEYGTGVARTSDGGENWIYEEPGFFGVATGLAFRKNEEAWACLSSEAKFILSSDSGQTWNIFNTPLTSQIFDIAFTDSLHGLAVGGGGVILKYIPSSPSANNDDELSVPETNFLFQNYPNPFNPSTRIQYQISNPSQVSLKVYDVLGNEVATLVDEYKSAGRYEVEFKSLIGNSSSKGVPSGLASGIYFYQLKAGQFFKSQKMILAQ
jgi:photosystem II stability/assembly factor-like uncharacterized protein